MYLISNDTDMLEELSKQAGSTHVSRAKSKNVEIQNKLFRSTVGENVSYTYSTEEERLFTVDQLMSFTNGEALVLSAVHRQDNSNESVRPNPIHNTRETLLPMAYALHKDGHNSPLFKTAVQNMEVTTSSPNKDEIFGNIPNFKAMYEHRKRQAQLVKLVREQYVDANNISEIELERMDKDIVSDTLMREIFEIMQDSKDRLTGDYIPKDMDVVDNDFAYNSQFISDEEELALEDEIDDEAEIIAFMENDPHAFSGNNPSTLSALGYDVEDDAVAQDLMNIASIENSYVADEDREYKDVIKRTEHASQVEADAKRDNIYLDGTFNYQDIEQSHQILTALGEAFTYSDVTADDITGRYQWVTRQGRYSIRDTVRDREVAYMSEEDTTGAVDDSWVVTDWFGELLRETASSSRIDVTDGDTQAIREKFKANADKVDALFDFDASGIVKNEFKTRFKETISN